MNPVEIKLEPEMLAALLEGKVVRVDGAWLCPSPRLLNLLRGTPAPFDVYDCVPRPTVAPPLSLRLKRALQTVAAKTAIDETKGKLTIAEALGRDLKALPLPLKERLAD